MTSVGVAIEDGVEARPGAGADGKGHCCLVRGAVQLAGSGDVAVMVRTGLMDVRSWWRMHGCCGWAILKVALAVSTVDRAGVCLRRGGWLRCVKGFNSGCFVVGGGRVVIGVCVAGCDGEMVRGTVVFAFLCVS